MALNDVARDSLGFLAGTVSPPARQTATTDIARQPPPLVERGFFVPYAGRQARRRGLTGSGHMLDITSKVC